MRKDKKEAIKLRRRNKSYREISHILEIPKSTLATWFKFDKLSHKTKLLLTEVAKKSSSKRIKKMNENNRLKWEKFREVARQEATKQFAALSQNPLFISGIMLYWAEGDSKLKNPLRFTNTDHRMITLYTKFLVNILKVSKKDLRLAMILYPDLSEEKCSRFWSKISNIPRDQFYKTQFIKGKHPTTRLSNGICMISYGRRLLKEKIAVWIDLLSKKL